jgi:hypothetical protein
MAELRRCIEGGVGSPWMRGGRRADAAWRRTQGGGGARSGARKEKVVPQAGWATQAGSLARPTKQKARKEFLLEIK